MPASRKNRIVLGVSLVPVGAVSAFLWNVNSRSSAPAVPKTAPAVTENPEHELKELAVQLQKKPGHIPVLLRMAQLEREKGSLDDAVGHLREAVKGEPSSQDAHLELGRALYERKDINGAISETEKVLELNPKQVDALYNMGAIYANLGNAERARSYWSKAVAADPNADSSRKAREALKKLGGS